MAGAPVAGEIRRLPLRIPLCSPSHRAAAAPAACGVLHLSPRVRLLEGPPGSSAIPRSSIPRKESRASRSGIERRGICDLALRHQPDRALWRTVDGAVRYRSSKRNKTQGPALATGSRTRAEAPQAFLRRPQKRAKPPARNVNAASAVAGSNSGAGAAFGGRSSETRS